MGKIVEGTTVYGTPIEVDLGDEHVWCRGTYKKAREAYIRRYGVEPEYVVDSDPPGYACAGPCPPREVIDERR